MATAEIYIMDGNQKTEPIEVKELRNDGGIGWEDVGPSACAPTKKELAEENKSADEDKEWLDLNMETGMWEKDITVGRPFGLTAARGNYYVLALCVTTGKSCGVAKAIIAEVREETESKLYRLERTKKNDETAEEFVKDLYAAAKAGESNMTECYHEAGAALYMVVVRKCARCARMRGC